MSPDFFDVHTHLNFSAYEKDLGNVWIFNLTVIFQQL